MSTTDDTSIDPRATTTDSGQSLIEIRGLSKRYPGVVALDHTELTIEPSSVLGLLGKNGAGKSTLIKILAGVVTPDEGTILIDGEPVHLQRPSDSTERGLSFVHQELADVPNLTVAENVELGLGYPKRAGIMIDRRALRRKAVEALKMLEAPIDPNARQSSLSVAHRRLVMIARGVAVNMRLLVLDEPTASLTADEIVHLHDVLRRLRDNGVAIVYVTHRLDEILAITDRVAVMVDGRTVFTAATAAVTQAQLVERISGQKARLALRPWSPPENGTPRAELLRVESLTRSSVVEDVSFVLRQGDILGIAGLVGAGRTELARLIFGADLSDSGRVLIRGEVVNLRGPRDAMTAGLALLPEDRRHQGTVSDFSVRKNITLASLPKFRVHPRLPLLGRRRESGGARDLIARLDIKVSDIDRSISTLSGGNQQKVAMAKWLSTHAEILILDEPTHGVDVGAKEEIYGLMRKLAAEGKGIIFISSEFTELVNTCNRVVVMRESRLVGDFEGAAISEHALIDRCYSEDAVATR